MAIYELYIPAICPECNSQNVAVVDNCGCEFQCLCKDCKHEFNHVMDI